MIVNLGSDWRRWQGEQWPAISRSRVSVEVVHRGAGKSVLACMRLLGWNMEAKGLTSAYIGPFQKQVRSHIWPIMKRLYAQVPGISFNETEMRVDTPTGGRILCIGSENAEAIRSATLNGGCVVDEPADVGPNAFWRVIYPAINRPGVTSRLLVVGTPKGMNNLFYELYERAGANKDWHRCFLPVTETGVYSAEEMSRLKAEMAEEDYAQEFLCDWSAAVKGAYFGKEMAAAEKAGHIGNVPHDPLLAVHTSLDLGIRHAFVVWLWQVLGSEVRAIGCKAFTGSSIPQIWAELAGLGYNWGQHYAPHDAKVRELGSGKSRLEIARAIGWNWREVPEIGLKAGIEAARSMIPRVWFDREGCKQAIEALKLYRPEYDDVSRTYSLQPMDLWANDYADAFRMFAVGQQGREPAWGPIDYGPVKIVA